VEPPGACLRKALCAPEHHAARRPGLVLSGERLRLFADELLPSSAADAAWLIDTGFGGRRGVRCAPRSQSLIPRTLPLSLLPLRSERVHVDPEHRSFTLYFNVKNAFTGNPEQPHFGSISAPARFRAEQRSTVTQHHHHQPRGNTIRLGAQGRPVVVYQAPIRLIATRWI